MDGNQAWITMLRRVPTNLHDQLALGLTTGSEIVVQKLVKLEPEFMIIRGRLSGTQDNGRIVLIPYGELTYVALVRLLKDNEVEAIFGKGTAPNVPDVVLSPSTEGDPLVDHSEEQAAEPAPEPEAAPARKPEISKTMLLAKLRSQLKDGKKP